MSKRLWLLGLVGLVLVGLLVACGSNYNSSSNGLLLVGSQGSQVIQTFSFGLNNGHVSSIANSTNDTGNSTCIMTGQPGSIVVDPSGSYAFLIQYQTTLCPKSETGIVTFKINSDGTITSAGNLTSLNIPTIQILGTPDQEQVPVVPFKLTMDTAGKFLFVADRATTDSAGRYVPGAVSVFTIGSGGSLSEVAGSPFYTTTPAMTLSQSGFDIVDVAPTPTVFPQIGINGVQNGVCQAPGNTPPTSEYLYAVDQLGDQIIEFVVDTTTGVLSLPNGPYTFGAGQTPAGIAVDPCDRFVYVSNSLSNNISAYTICNGTATQSQFCAQPTTGNLFQVSGSPFSISGNTSQPGPLVVDPFGNNVYVVGVASNTISLFKISSATGGISAMTPATVATGSRPTAIAIRADDNWMFVSNFNSGNVSQYSVTPNGGALSVAQPITTDNQPFGVAVK